MSEASQIEIELHPRIKSRLNGIHQQLMGAYLGGQGMSSASIGTEREAFISHFLKAIFPEQYRFGTGDIVDSYSNDRSGQADIVLEYPFSPSLPMAGGRGPRLYLAEGVGAVIEIKSNLQNQWEEVRRTSEQIRPLKQKDPRGTWIKRGSHRQFDGRIPIFAVGYTGWAKQKTLSEKLNENVVDGILIINSGLFASLAPYELVAEGVEGLWGLVCNLLGILGPKATGVFDGLDYFLQKPLVTCAPSSGTSDPAAGGEA